MIYDVADRVLFFLTDALGRLWAGLWRRFLGFTLAGKAFTIVVVLYAGAWLLAKTGLDPLAHELAQLAATILSALLAWLVIRHIWRRFTQPSRFRW